MLESKEVSPFTLAKKKLPFAWYELTSIWQFRLRSSLLCGAYAGFFASQYGDLTGPISVSLLAGGLYFVSEVFDIASTDRALDSAYLARANSIKHGYAESNLFLRGLKHSEQNNPKLLLPLVIGYGISVVLPGIGFPLAAIKTLAALSNYRLARRLDLATQIALSRSPNPQVIS